MKLWRKLSRQYNFGPIVGGFKDLASRTMIYVSVLNFILISATAYHTTLKDFIFQYSPWVTFPVYMAFLIIVVLIAMALEYKFIVPSSYTFLNKQEYEHRNLLRRDLRKIMKHLGISSEEKPKCPHCGKEID